MPGLPGAACNSSRRVLCASFQARACSRPPAPTRSTLTRASLVGFETAESNRGLDGDDVDPELRAQIEAADEAVRLLHEEPDALSPGDVAAAIEGYGLIYEALLAGHQAP